MEYVVDVQGFKSTGNKFVFKEVAVVALQDDPVPGVCHFQAPFDWIELSPQYKSINRWLEYNYHGIPWKSGEIPYSEVTDTLQVILAKAQRIFVKGLEKKEWLQEILPDKILLDLADLGCPALNTLPEDENIVCTIHRLRYNHMCAVKNAYALKEWLLQGYRPEKSTFYGVDEVDYPTFEPMACSSMNEDSRCNILHSMYT